MRTRSENKLPNTRENASDQVAIGSSFESDWLRKWRVFWTNYILSKARTKQSYNTFDN